MTENPYAAPVGEASKRGTRGCLVVAAIAALIPVLTITYAVLKIRWAHGAATEMCNTYAVNDPFDIAEFERRASARGLQSFCGPAVPEARTGPTCMAWEGFVFSRWFCDIEHTDKVVALRVNALD